VRRWPVALLSIVAACSRFTGQETSDGGASDAAPGDVGVGDAAPSDAGSTSDDGGAADTGQGADGPATDGPATGDDGGTGCSGSACPIETVVGGLNQATLVVLDTTNVYFGDEGTTTGVVYQCPKSGCATPTVLGPGFATGIGVDGKNVYWNDFAGGKVVACAIGGCSNTPTTIAPTQPSAEGVTFDGTNLYWASSGNVLTCVPPACSPRPQLAAGQGTIVHVASETGAAYWVSGGALVGCPAAGCSATPTKVGSPASGGSVFVLNGVAYFTSGNAVVSCPVGGGCTTPHTIGASDDPYGIGSDGVDVYWLDDLDQVVFRCPVSGCNAGAEHFATGQLSQPGANVALDGEYAYWTVPDQVVRKHK
jgi:hypothetical protein